MDDATSKRLFTHPAMVRDLLAGPLLPRERVLDLDLGTLGKEPAAFVSDRNRQRYADMVWSVGYRERAEREPWERLFLLLEFQSRSDLAMPLRIMVYGGLLMQDLLRQRRGVGPNGELPVAMPVVVYDGETPWRGPVRLAEMGVRWFFAACCVVLDLKRIPAEHLTDGSALSLRIAIEQCGSLDELVALEARLLARPAHQSLRRLFAQWIREARLPALDADPSERRLLEDEDMLARKAEIWSEEFRREGREEGHRELLRDLAELRFGEEAAPAVALIERIDDIERLRDAGRWVIECRDAGELRERLEAARWRKGSDI